MILSDKSIKERIAKGNIRIEPFNTRNVQPSSVDLHLDKRFIIFNNHRHAVLDVKQKVDNHEIVDVSDDGFFVIHPNEFVLATTIEHIHIPNDLVGILNGRSSVGRLGLIIHATAGYIDPGFTGKVTLEMLNMSGIPIKIYPGMRIAQLSYQLLSTPAQHPYGSEKTRNKYHGQDDVTPSQIWRDFLGN